MATRDQQLSAIMTAESGGKNSFNYLYNTNPSYYTASGYYQIVNSTWQQGAQWAGVDTSQYPTAISAPFDVQTKVASSLIDHQGMQPWAGSKANTLISQIDAGQSPNLITGPVDGGGGSLGNLTASNVGQGTPDYYTGHDPTTGLPVSSTDPNSPQFGVPGVTDWQPHYASPTGTGGGGGAATGAGSGTAAGAGMPGYLPPALTGGPMAVGITPGLAGALQSDVTSTQQTAKDIASGAETATGIAFRNAWQGLLGSLSNWISRWFLIVAALVLIAVALWRLADPDGKQIKIVLSKAGAVAA
jgi:hypothetical protein